MTYAELKALYRAALVTFVADAEYQSVRSDDIGEAVHEREYDEPEFDNPVPDEIAVLAALIVDNPAISEQEIDEVQDTITVWDAMYIGVNQQLRDDLHADWLTIKTEAQAKP